MKKSSFIHTLLFALAFIAFFSCSDGESNTIDEETPAEEALEVKMETEIPTSKELTITREGIEETIMADLYAAPEAAPVDFFTYVPDDFEVTQSEQGGNYITIFSREEANLSLTILPESADRSTAIEAAKSRINRDGTAVKDDLAGEESYYLANTSEGVLRTTVGEHNGRYYYWTSDYPTEYGDGFAPMTVLIKENLTWK